MAADSSIPLADSSIIALPFAFCLRTAAATFTARTIERPTLDHVRLADVECQPNNAAIAIVAGPRVIPVELSPARIVATARPLRGRGSFWE